MTAHVLYPALDPDRPATLSRRIATELLRGELGFRGVLVSDDLGMKAVADRYSIEELAVGAIEAGCDHLSIREPEARQSAAFEAMVRAAEARADFRTRVEESAARVAALKAACRVGSPRRRRCCLRCSARRRTGRWRDRSARRRRRPRRARLWPTVTGTRGFGRPIVGRCAQSGRPWPGPRRWAAGWRGNVPLRASVSCTACIARIEAARSPAGALVQVAEQEGVVEQHEAARAQVVGGPVEVARVALFVGVDEDQIVRALRATRRGSTSRAGPTWTRALAGEAGATEALARDLGVARLALDGVELAPPAQAAQDRDARVAAQRADLDGASRTRRAGQHLQVARVERRRPGCRAARRRRCARGSRSEPRPRARTVRPAIRRAPGRRFRSSCSCLDPAAPKPQGQQRLEQHQRDGRCAQRVPQLEPAARRRAGRRGRRGAIGALVVGEHAPDRTRADRG